MIIADADNGISAVLNSDSPPTKMFVYGTKARDDQARNCVVLDFDGCLGRVSDPEFNEGNITEVDNILYDDQVTEEDIISDDGLFDEKIEELNNVDFSFIEDSPAKPDVTEVVTDAPKKEVPQGLEDDELFDF